MLVALQRTGDERRLPAAAAHVVALLRSWGPGPQHLTGLALAGITVPSRAGPRFVDALVFTRCGIVVIAAHEPGSPPGAGERAGAGVAAAKDALSAHDGGRYVTGLVAVVPGRADDDRWRRGPGLGEAPGPADENGWPAAGSGEVPGPADETGWPAAGSGEVPGPAGRDRPEPGFGAAPEVAFGQQAPGPVAEPRAPEQAGAPELASAPGVAVVLADPRGLRRIIGQHNRWRTVWSADDVLDACYALSLAHLAPPRAALLADGFPARLPALSPLPVLPAVLPVPPALPPPPLADAGAGEPGPRVPVPRGPGSAVFPRPRPIRQVPWGLVVVLTLLVIVGVVAAVFVAQNFHGS